MPQGKLCSASSLDITVLARWDLTVAETLPNWGRSRYEITNCPRDSNTLLTRQESTALITKPTLLQTCYLLDLILLIIPRNKMYRDQYKVRRIYTSFIMLTLHESISGYYFLALLLMFLTTDSHAGTKQNLKTSKHSISSLKSSYWLYNKPLLPLFYTKCSFDRVF